MEKVTISKPGVKYVMCVQSKRKQANMSRSFVFWEEPVHPVSLKDWTKQDNNTPQKGKAVAKCFNNVDKFHNVDGLRLFT